MDYRIREMEKDEYPLLKNFLYEAIYIPEGEKIPDKSIVNLSELQIYYKDFGSFKDDIALAADVKDKVIGAAWVRIMDDYGHIDNETPSLAMSLFKEYRNLGIGTVLLNELLSELKIRGYLKVSLSVQKDNYAQKMYKKAGFKVIKENEEEYIMLAEL
ncbi:GNAT family N-acetyltransferase [Pseudoleptotrichia goodfellowii]|jgi:Acetyltransferases|uniref:Acetyltransferase, GNAT family n=2 Tax=Pseudoleptotrichia goodfellowii TaxID=157692 RepID=D0GLY9_9FUSO|nr:GNAT family N-acetyltransferase [Pseudoleptotrichia goodfellowii]EEY34875.1 acetyltransferase, GNAT family [Pseudoleptotrichia goodfellowii F0264]MBF4805917.1 GNAT family N-acetyltransferase [Pseudoleptotrichia goodfellowii]